MPVPELRESWSGRASLPVVAMVLMVINCRSKEVDMEGPYPKQPSLGHKHQYGKWGSALISFDTPQKPLIHMSTAARHICGTQ